MRLRLKPLNQQVFIVTGASSGIGLATARRAAQAGAKVFLAARDGDALARICDEIRAQGGTADFAVVDVASEQAVHDLARAAVGRFGGFDTWVNVAGVCLLGQLKDVLTEDHRRLFEVNYWGLVYGSLAAVRHFRELGKAGALINVGSAASEIPLPYAAAYTASKFAVKGFTNALRMELAHEELPVSVTFIKPGAVDTPFFHHSKTMLGGVTKMPPPRYTPRVVADAIVAAAHKPRREIVIGFPTLFGGKFVMMFPGLPEWVMSFASPSGIVDKAIEPPEITSLHSVPAEGKERSGYQSARSFSITTLVQAHTRAGVAAVVVLALGGIALYLAL